MSGLDSVADERPFAVEVVRAANASRVAPRGELDLATAGELEHALEDVLTAGVERLVLDLRGLEFLDSSGMAVMLGLHKRSVLGEFELMVVRGLASVQRVLILVGLDHVFTFVDDFDELSERE